MPLDILTIGEALVEVMRTDISHFCTFRVRRATLHIHVLFYTPFCKPFTHF